MTIARAQMYRQLYQMGGIGTLPMDYGQSLQVNNQSQMPIPNYSSAVNITANPLLNYGQTELNQSGGTPLTMRSGGITRLGYQEGGMGMMQPQTPQIKDPKQALEIIIQMLIEQGIPPEQARQIALQMVQAVAEGGMGEMEDKRIEARFGGSINGREQYGIGSIFKGAAKAVSGVVKGVTNAVKSVASSSLGKAALAAAAIYFGGPALAGALEGTTAGNFLFGVPGFGAEAATSGIFGYGGAFSPMTGSLLSPITQGINQSAIGTFLGGIGTGSGSGILSNILPAATGFVGGMFSKGQPKREDYGSDEEYRQALAQWNATLS